MSHVVSSQPSSTSPYQPTEIQEPANGQNTRIKSTIETRQDRDDCCFRADKSQGCFIYYCCNFLSSVCGAIRDCTENCCNCCADCLADCCEDKPDDRNKRRRYRNGSSQVDNDYDDNTWVVDAIHHQNTVSEDQPALYTTQDSSNHDSGHHNNSHCHDYNTGHHTSAHDSGFHHSSGPDSGGHHSSVHDSGGHHSSSHDSGGATCDAGDYGGGGDTGGGDSGGGGCDD